MSETTETSLPECANCSAPLEGAYCHACGQRAKEPRRMVVGLVQDVIVETLSIDSKLARTVWTLFRAPGRLAKAYISGQRVRYSPPFRLYLFTSVVFFAALFWMLTSELQLNAPPEPSTDAAQVEGAVEPAGDGAGEAPPGPGDRNAPEIAVEAPDDPINGEINLGVGEGTAWGEAIEARLEGAVARLQEDPRLFVAQARDNIPRVMLLAPLVYGLLLVILYIYRRKFLIYDHLIVSLYMHAALYAYMLTIMLVLQLPAIGGVLAGLVGVWGVLQPYAVLRQAYGSNWFSVVAKGTLIHSVYFAVFIVLVTAGLGFALYNS